MNYQREPIRFKTFKIQKPKDLNLNVIKFELRFIDKQLHEALKYLALNDVYTAKIKLEKIRQFLKGV